MHTKMQMLADLIKVVKTLRAKETAEISYLEIDVLLRVIESMILEKDF